MGLGKVVFVGFANSAVPQTNDQSVCVKHHLQCRWHPASALVRDHRCPSVFDGDIQRRRMYANRLLVWIFNPTNSASTFTLDLNGTTILPSSWETVQYGPQREPRFWLRREDPDNRPCGCPVGVLIVPRSEPLVSYSSGLLQTQFAYPDQSLYSILGTYNQSVLVVISTNDLVGQSS